MSAVPPPPGASDESSATHTSGAAPDSSRDFGEYRLLQQVGEGGMGEVWLAEQIRPVRRRVAIKVIKPGMDSAQVVARFEAERQTLALMQHPSIAAVLDGGTTPEGRPYFAMEYVRGEPITTFCDRQRLSVRERLALFIELCDGVQHAHQKGIIHRDLKPSNVLVSLVSDRPVPRIIDFGIAKAVAQPLTDRSLFTALGTFIGTPEYMSPEQAELTPLDVDTRSDVYSLGVLLYELLAGTLPFDQAFRESGLDEMRRLIRDVDPPRPSTRVLQGAASSDAAERRRTQPARLAALLRKDLDWIVMKALEKDRTRRYATANALGLDLQRYLANEPVSARSPSRTYRTAKFVRRHRVGVAMAAGVLLLLTSFAVVMAVQTQRISRERDRANLAAMTATQVSDFLVDLFRVSDPSEARGSSLTAREILDSGVSRIEGRLQDHPRVRARLLATMGAVYTGLGLYSGAQPLLERALATQREVLGSDDAETLQTANDLANLYWYQAKYHEAEPLYGEVVGRRTRLLGAEHPDTLRAAFDLASSFLQQGRFDDYERLGRETLQKQRRVLGDDHQDTLASLNNLQNFFYRRGRYAEAEAIALAVLDARRRTLGPAHPRTITAVHNLATINERLGRHTQAEALYREAIEGRRSVLGEHHPWTAQSRLAFAGLLLALGRHAEAETLALSASQTYLQVHGAGHDETREAIDKLSAIYEASGQPSKAATWRALLKNTGGGQL